MSETSPLKLFSVLEEMIRRSPAKKAQTREQWLQELNPRRDILIGDVKHPLKREELEYSGIPELTEPKTKEELLQMMKERPLPNVQHLYHGNYSRYTLPGEKDQYKTIGVHWNGGTQPVFDKRTFSDYVADLRWKKEKARKDAEIIRDKYNRIRSMVEQPGHTSLKERADEVEAILPGYGVRSQSDQSYLKLLASAVEDFEEETRVWSDKIERLRKLGPDYPKVLLDASKDSSHEFSALGEAVYSGVDRQLFLNIIGEYEKEVAAAQAQKKPMTEAVNRIIQQFPAGPGHKVQEVIDAMRADPALATMGMREAEDIIRDMAFSRTLSGGDILYALTHGMNKSYGPDIADKIAMIGNWKNFQRNSYGNPLREAENIQAIVRMKPALFPKVYEPGRASETIAYTDPHNFGEMSSKNLMSFGRSTGRARTDNPDVFDTHMIEEAQSGWHQDARDAAKKDKKRVEAQNEGVADRLAHMQAIMESLKMEGGHQVRPYFSHGEDSVAYDKHLSEWFKKNYPAGFAPNEEFRQAMLQAVEATHNALRDRPPLKSTVTGYEGKDAPLKGDLWFEQILRQHLLDAINMDRPYVGLTTGEQQIKRYENALRDQVDEIRWEKTPEGKYNLIPMKGGHVAASDERLMGLDADTLHLPIGSDMAERILEREKALEQGTYSGVSPFKQKLRDLGYTSVSPSIPDDELMSNLMGNHIGRGYLEKAGLLGGNQSYLINVWHAMRDPDQVFKEQLPNITNHTKKYLGDLLIDDMAVRMTNGRPTNFVLSPDLRSFSWEGENETYDILDFIKKRAMEDAAKMPAVDARRLTGDDLSIGGTGMRLYYDQKGPNYLDRLFRQYGGRRLDNDLTIGGNEVTDLRGGLNESQTPGWFMTDDMIRKIRKQGGLPLWSMGPAAVGLPALAPGEDQQYAVGGAIHGLPRIR